jgi:lysophospholipase L1-like esterase
MGCAPVVGRLLAGKIRVEAVPENGGDSSNVLANLDKWVIGRQPYIIHFNCGLHDLRVDPKTGFYQQSIDRYRKNLEEIVRRLRAKTEAKLVWATITPVIVERHNKSKPFYRYDRDIDAYNRAATNIMARDGNIAIDDLHAVVEHYGRAKCISDDGVHMTAGGYEVLAQSVAESLLAATPE